MGPAVHLVLGRMEQGVRQTGLLCVALALLVAQCNALDQNTVSVVLEAMPKSGHCPHLIDSGPQFCVKNETSSCSGDSDCADANKCCSDGCRMVCVEPLYSACEHQRAAILKRGRALGDEAAAAARAREPRCRSDGAFEPIQCDGQSSRCWCTDEAGFEIAGTRAASKDAVNCSAPRFCSGLMCRMLCPYDFELDEHGCPLCQCRDPCSGIECPGNQQCHLEDVMCATEPCPPVPSCKQARMLLDSICPSGDPLYLSEKSQPFVCGVEVNKPQCPPFFACVVQPNMEYGACCPTLDQIEKPGECPKSAANDTECGTSCTTDGECLGLLKCCASDKCSQHCAKSSSSECEVQKMLAELLSRNEKEDRGYVPQCTDDGKFKSQQCSRNGLVCWCVDERGKKLPKTMGPAENVSCSRELHILSSASCDEVICAAFCEYGYKLDQNDCQTCECADPCDGFPCPTGLRCIAGRNNSCIESFCPSIPTCEPVLERTRKPGVCPSIEERGCLNMSMSCNNDTNCPGGQRCCPHECGASCADIAQLPDRLPTMCEYLRAYALSDEELPMQRMLAYSPPQCTKEGLYEPVQCDGDGRCWCVDEFGVELPNTRASSQDLVDCRRAQARVNCLGLMCRLGCDYGFVRDDSGCPVCECRNPCDNMLCPHDQQCQLMEVQNGCSGLVCPPIPICISTAKSLLSCPVGEPLSNSVLNGTVRCGVGDELCPETHFCLEEEGTIDGICCIKNTADACLLSKDVGVCLDKQERWYHNTETGRCEAFVFGGCGGNMNNFVTLDECEKTCIINRDGPPKPGMCPEVTEGEVGVCAEECSNDLSCPGPQKCCLNGCGAHTCRDPAGSAGKRGQCPFLVPINADTCELECRSDYDCVGSSKCCSNGCGTSCVEAEVKTACEHQKSVAEYKAREAGIPASQVFIPHCRDEDGSFARVQCLPVNHTCWCVDDSGRELAGTRTADKVEPDCAAGPQRCSSIFECSLQCDHGLELDVNGCPTCACFDPCSSVVCSDREECRMVNVQCVTSPCPPVPMCLPRLDNPCGEGEPLRDLISHNVLRCGPQGSHCPSTHKCHLSPLNEFAVCCPKPRDACLEPQQSGRCLAAIPRWHFDPLKNSCEEFVYGGCGGNLNNFQTREDCRTVCPVMSSCERVRERNLKMISTGRREMFIPKCNRVTGSWDPVQCLPSLGLCWCVTRDGEQQPGTLIRGLPQCSARTGRKFTLNDMTICKPGEIVHLCDSNVCEGKVCLAHPSAVCRVNPCGGCNPEFFNETGDSVNCTDGLSICQQDLQTVLNSHAWATQGGHLSFSHDPLDTDSASDNHLVVVKKRGIVDDALELMRHLVPGTPTVASSRSLVRTFFEPELIKPGLCPVPRMRNILKDLLLLRPDSCSVSCFLDSDCPDDKKCCMSGCGMTCTAPATPTWLVKSGRCPTNMPEDITALDCLEVQKCQFDLDCRGNSKCCNSGCGSICAAPIGDSEITTKVDSESQPSENLKAFVAALVDSTTTTTTSSTTTTTTTTEPSTTVRPAPVALFMGVVLPRCHSSSGYLPTQSSDSVSWCSTEDGEPIHDSISRGIIQCSPTGQVLLHSDSDPVCPNGITPMVCKEDCIHAYCPSHPDAICRADPCNFCLTTFHSPEGEEVLCDDKCTQALEVGICRASFPRWFYNQTSGRCEEFIFGGCRGNDNNFNTYEACSQECQAPLDICRQPKRIGMCRASMHRWFYNQLTKKCEEFIYGGCDGNDNNFETQEECDARCPDLVLCGRLNLDSGMQACSRRSVCAGLTCPAMEGQEDVVCTVDPCNNCSTHFVNLDGMIVQCDVNSTNHIAVDPTVSAVSPTSPTQFITPISSKKTRCQKLKLWAIANEERIPRCDKFGHFEPMQCDDPLVPGVDMICWCVDEAGNQLDGLPHFRFGAQTCKRVGVEKVDVSLAFRQDEGESTNPHHVKEAVMNILQNEEAKTADEIAVETEPDVVYVKFILVGDNKVDVAYSLEEQMRTGNLALTVDGRQLQALHSASTFRHELADFQDDDDKFEATSNSLAVVTIFAVLCVLLLIVLLFALMVYRKRKTGSYPKGSMESLASSTSPIYAYENKVPLPTSPEFDKLNNPVDEKKMDISTIENEYSATKKEPPV